MTQAQHIHPTLAQATQKGRHHLLTRVQAGQATGVIDEDLSLWRNNYYAIPLTHVQKVGSELPRSI